MADVLPALLTYRVFIKHCVFFPSNFGIFLNSVSSAAALVFYLPCMCTHTDTEGKPRKARVRNILESSEKTQYLMNTLYSILSKRFLDTTQLDILPHISRTFREFLGICEERSWGRDRLQGCSCIWKLIQPHPTCCPCPPCKSSLYKLLRLQNM